LAIAQPLMAKPNETVRSVRRCLCALCRYYRCEPLIKLNGSGTYILNAAFSVANTEIILENGAEASEVF
jgi:hypothetical protein